MAGEELFYYSVQDFFEIFFSRAQFSIKYPLYISVCFFARTINVDGMTHHQQFEHHEHAGHKCRLCSSSHDPDHKASVGGICHGCVYKILVVVFIVMIAISYIAWFGVF